MRLALSLLFVVACSEPIVREPLGDYTTWKRVDVTGRAPGHGNTYRIIYVNDLAADPDQPLVPGYPEGSILVKEIRANDDGQPGALDYIAIMRREGPVDAALVDEGGWLFTETDTMDGPETAPSYCWRRCHAAAPYNGVWYDYRK